jgi:hypothetical protein
VPKRVTTDGDTTTGSGHAINHFNPNRMAEEEFAEYVAEARSVQRDCLTSLLDDQEAVELIKEVMASSRQEVSSRKRPTGPRSGHKLSGTYPET